MNDRKGRSLRPFFFVPCPPMPGINTFRRFENLVDQRPQRPTGLAIGIGCIPGAIGYKDPIDARGVRANLEVHMIGFSSPFV